MVSRAIRTSTIITSRTRGIEGEKRGIDVIEDLHDFFPVWRRKLVTPLKCLVENVDKHIKNGIVPLNRKNKTPASLVPRAVTSNGLSPSGQRPGRCDKGPKKDFKLKTRTFENYWTRPQTMPIIFEILFNTMGLSRF